MKNDTMKYAIAPEAHKRLSEIRILLSQAVESHRFAEAENDGRKELAFRAMVTTLLITANRELDTIMERAYAAQAVQQ